MKKIGIALGGGGARGFTHIHVIEAFDELGIKPHKITGSSIGALIGASWASGMTGKEIKEHFISVFSRPKVVLEKLWKLRPPSFSKFFQSGIRITQFDLQSILKNFLPPQIPEKFEDLEISFLAVAVDLKSSLEVALDYGDLLTAISASASIPTLFSPVLRNNMLLLDGGLSNPVPFDYLKPQFNITIAVDVLGNHLISMKNKRLTTMESIVAATFLSQKSLIETRLNFIRPSLLLSAPVDGIYLLDFLKVKHILESTSGFKEEVKRAIGKLIDKST